MSEKPLLEPGKATIVSVRRLTEGERVFEIELDSGESLGHEPGQFVQVYVPGFGEAPISITSSPTKEGPFELCVRAVGNVTNALHSLEVGDNIGIRGPYGNGFDVGFFEGKDMLFVAGGLGLAPLRSLINYVVDNREDYGKVTTLYGCKTPLDLLFEGELKRWEESDVMDFSVTVDKCPVNVTWNDNVGVITELIPGIDVDPEGTYSAVCGPPVMYKFVIQELKEKEIPDNHIFLSLERRMRCGVGECGHCQIGEFYACIDGPVFNYSDIKGVEEAL
ncbi:oxidoreductase [candidate division MSBL1 archaeon SCGC-AAA382M17]|uniref:Oxidoreductase n=1 Tax=candidate division MSBL1 archaeon SCGC-AAA382M17 TaxID=1698284 RepID=A0ABR5TJP5_9EURY|nr:oxidoreductase [candidate division MSBL1 archaeon SCGC-AAA382M17]